MTATATPTSSTAWGHGLATVVSGGAAERRPRHLVPRSRAGGAAGRRGAAGQLVALAGDHPDRRVRTEVVTVEIDLTAAPQDASDAYLRLHLLSHRLVAPHGQNVDGIFGVLANVVWTSAGPCPVDDFEATRIRLRAGGPVQVFGLDKFPRMTDYVVPAGVRIADADRVRLGAHLAEGTTVMHEGFVNYNAGTLGSSMVEGRISAGVVVGDGSDVGGGSSIMGTLSGGGKQVISIGERCLLGANSGIGISLGDDCVVEAGCYVTAGTKVTVLPLSTTGRRWSRPRPSRGPATSCSGGTPPAAPSRSSTGPVSGSSSTRPCTPTEPRTATDQYGQQGARMALLAEAGPPAPPPVEGPRPHRPVRRALKYVVNRRVGERRRDGRHSRGPTLFGAGPVTERCSAQLEGSDWYLSPDQADNAALVAGTSVARGLPARAATIGLATALQESKLINIDYGDRDSVGLFQQRPSQDWGTARQIMDPVYSTNAFYDVLVKVEGYKDMAVTEAAQEVQRSAYPDAYAEHETRSPGCWRAPSPGSRGAPSTARSPTAPRRCSAPARRRRADRARRRRTP